MGEGPHQSEQAPTVLPLVLMVEQMIADDEREGGKTMRELAAGIVRAVLVDLRDKGLDIPASLVHEVGQTVR